MAITVRETLQVTGIDDQVLTAGAGTLSGDVLVVTQTWNVGTAASMAQPSPGTWTSAALGDVGADLHKIRIWVRAATVGGSQAITIASSGEFDGMHARMRVLAGADSSDPIVAGAGDAGFVSPGALAAPSTTGEIGALLCCDWVVDSEITYVAPPTGMTASGAQTTDFTAAYGAHQVLAAGGATGTRTPVVSGGGSWAATSVTIRAGSTGVTGTLAETEEADSLAASGTVTPPSFTGTLAVTEAADTLAASGTHTPPAFTGTLAVTEQADTLAASGTFAPEGISGSLAETEAADTLSASGTHTPPSFTGTIAFTEASDTLAAAGTVVIEGIAGNLAVTEASDTLDAAGVFTAPPVPPAVAPAATSTSTVTAGATSTTVLAAAGTSTSTVTGG